ncbi:MAG: hypothetical protein ACLFVU_07730 [Phycisphaerae bacterium]
MSTAGSYLRQHPWQRRAVSAGLVLILAGIAAFFLYPYVRDHMLLSELGSEDPLVRRKAVDRAIGLAANDEGAARRLNHAAADVDDRTFLSIVTVLRHVKRFTAAEDNPALLDRLNSILLRRGEEEHTRGEILRKTVLMRRDNRYVREIVDLGTRDELPRIRSLAASLAARLGDTGKLWELTADADPAVASTALIDLALLGVTADAPQQISELTQMAMQAESDDLAAAAGMVLAAGEQTRPTLLGILEKTLPGPHRDKLLLVAMRYNTAGLDELVRKFIIEAGKKQRDLSPTELLTAGRLGLPEARELAEAILTRAITPGARLTRGQLLAALTVAGRTKAPVLPQVYTFIEKYWSRELQLAQIHACRTLGQLLADPAAQPDDAPTAEQCKQLLLARADIADTPAAAAEAAWQAWRMNPAPAEPWSFPPDMLPEVALKHLLVNMKDTELRVRQVAQFDQTLAGDLLSWNIGRSGRDEAVALGKVMLPSLGDHPALSVYNDNERATGAMLLAISADSEQEKQAARDRITHRLAGNGYGEDSFFVERTYQCALLILGAEDKDIVAQGLLTSGSFPERRAFTALMLSGTGKPLEWLLWNPFMSDDRLINNLVSNLLAEVIAETRPDLPRFDIPLQRPARLWQIRLMRQAYMLKTYGRRGD